MQMSFPQKNVEPGVIPGFRAYDGALQGSNPRDPIPQSRQGTQALKRMFTEQPP